MIVIVTALVPSGIIIEGITVWGWCSLNDVRGWLYLNSLVALPLGFASRSSFAASIRARLSL